MTEEEIEYERELTKKIADTLIEIINTAVGQDIRLHTRHRPCVEGRGIFSKIMREGEGWTYSQIGKLFQKSHATVLHAIGKIDNLLTFDEETRKLYTKILTRYEEMIALHRTAPHFMEYLEGLSPAQLQEKIYHLTTENQKLNSYIVKLSNLLNLKTERNSEREKLYSLIENKVSREKIDLVYKRLNQLLNGL